MIIELVMAASHHFAPGNWNEVHPAIRISDGPVFGVAYHNSEDNLSLGLGYKAEAGPMFFEAAVVTGYEAFPVVPMLRAGVDTGRVRAWVAPSMTPDGDPFLLTGAEIYFTIGD